MPFAITIETVFVLTSTEVHVLLVFWEEIKEEEWGIIEISEWIDVCGQLHKSLSFNRHCRLIVVVV
jgi:hypothetical protein